MSNRVRGGLNGGIPGRVLAKKERKGAGLDKPEPKIFRLETKDGPIGPIVSLLHLNDDRCRWPLGNPQHETFGYCGHPTTQAPYCAHHYALAFTPGSGRHSSPNPMNGYVCEPMQTAGN